MSTSASDDEVISFVDDLLKNQKEAFYISAIRALQHRWQECVDLGVVVGGGGGGGWGGGVGGVVEIMLNNN